MSGGHYPTRVCQTCRVQRGLSRFVESGTVCIFCAAAPPQARAGERFCPRCHQSRAEEEFIDEAGYPLVDCDQCRARTRRYYLRISGRRLVGERSRVIAARVALRKRPLRYVRCLLPRVPEGGERQLLGATLLRCGALVWAGEEREHAREVHGVEVVGEKRRVFGRVKDRKAA